MAKILNIRTSINGENSASNKLSDTVIEKLKAAYPGSEVRARDFSTDPIPHLEARNFYAFGIPEENKTDEQKEATKYSDEAIREIFDADILVIGVPFYNFGIPSTLKSWLDNIAVAGKTFNYVDGQPIGYVTGKKVYLNFALGGIYSDGPAKGIDTTEPYLRTILGFIGLTDITAFRAEGLLIPGIKETALSKTLESVDNYHF